MERGSDVGHSTDTHFMRDVDRGDESIHEYHARWAKEIEARIEIEARTETSARKRARVLECDLEEELRLLSDKRRRTTNERDRQMNTKAEERRRRERRGDPHPATGHRQVE